MKPNDFMHFANDLVGKEVEVITSEGTYSGTLLSVGSDSIIMETTIRGRSVRLAIRIALIVALFRLVTGSRRRGPFWAQSTEGEEESSSS